MGTREINQPMSIPYWRLSGFYFFYFATVGTFIPYWGLYLKESGFNPVQIGELSAILNGTRIFSPILWGWIADHTGRNLRIIRIATFFTAAFFAGFLFVHGYFWFAWITAAFSCFWNASLPQFEAVTLYHLKTKAHHYSRIRLWGSIGFIVSVLGVGRLLDDQPPDIIPIAITAIMTLIWVVSLMTPAIQAPHHQAAVGIKQILKKPELWAFLIVYMLLQLAHSPYYVFYSIYLKHYQYTPSLTGFLWSLAVFSEIVLFIYLYAPLAETFFPEGDLIVQYFTGGCPLVNNCLGRRLFLAVAFCAVFACCDFWRRSCGGDSSGSSLFWRPASGQRPSALYQFDFRFGRHDRQLLQRLLLGVVRRSIRLFNGGGFL